MQIISGKIPRAIKTLVYGPEGIGKSTFASQFPNPVFIDTEGSTTHMDVRRTPRPASWTELMEQVKHFASHPDEAGTLVIDTADWAEILCAEQVCARAQKTGIEDFGYGKGYTYLAEEFGRLLNALEVCIERGVNVVVTAHAKMRKFEQPDEMGAYDRWEMKLSKTCAPLLKEWADMVLFASYKTLVVNVDGQGTQKGKNKAQGGMRVLRTTHHPCWDAKNRFSLPEEVPFEFKSIVHIIPDRPKSGQDRPKSEIKAVAAEPSKPESELKPEPKNEAEMPDLDLYDGLPTALANLMREAKVKPNEVVYAVAQRGYYPAKTPIANYDPAFIDGVLVAAWPQVLKMIQDNRADEPF